MKYFVPHSERAPRRISGVAKRGAPAKMMRRLTGIGNGAKTTAPLSSRRLSSLLLRSAIQMGAAIAALEIGGGHEDLSGKAYFRMPGAASVADVSWEYSLTRPV